MINKLASDILSRYHEKLAHLEKNASKWARRTADLLGDKFTFEDYKNMFNQAYSSDPHGYYSDIKEDVPNAAGYTSDRVYRRSNFSKTEDLRNRLSNIKFYLGSKEKRDLVNNLLKNYELMNPKEYSEGFKDPITGSSLPYDFDAPASEFFDFTDEFFNPRTKKMLEQEYGKPESVSEAFSRAGKRNPIIKGLTTNNPISNTNMAYNGGADNKVHTALYDLHHDKYLGELSPLNLGLPSRPKENDVLTTAFSGYWPVSTWYSTNNDFSVADLNNIWSDMQKLNANVRPTPNIGYQNLEDRDEYIKKFNEVFGTDMKNVVSDIHHPNYWRKSEVLIPQDLAASKLNAQAFHVFDPDKPDSRLLLDYSPDLDRTTLASSGFRGKEKSYDLKNWLKSDEAKRLQAIPLEGYTQARQDMQNFLKDNVTEMQQSGKKLFGTWSPKFISKNYNLLDMFRKSGIQIDKINWLKPFLKVRK